MLWRHAARGWVLVACACGPESSWVEPELESLACGTREPIQVSPRATSIYNFLGIGDDWTLVDFRSVSETEFALDAVVFDPCGEAAIEVYEASVLLPAGDGFVRCSAGAVAWAPTRDATPVMMTPSEHCMSATLTAHGLLVQDEGGALQLFAAPDAQPRPIAAGIAETHNPPRDPLWFAEGDLVWYVTNEQRIERYDLRSGERLVLAERVDNLTVAPGRDLVAWTRRVDESTGVTSVHRVATGDVLEFPGFLVELWPGLVITSTGDDMTVIDVARGSADTVRNPGWYRVLRANQGMPSMVAAAPRVGGDAIGRLDLGTGEFHPLVEVGGQYLVAPDPHGDGVVVAEPIDDTPDDDEHDIDRYRIVRVSHVAATALVESAAGTWALARDGRLLYKPMLPDGTASPDLHVRNPDGSDRVFARSAWLIAPHPWSVPYALEDFPDLEGDVLVKISAGETAALWRMPFDAPL